MTVAKTIPATGVNVTVAPDVADYWLANFLYKHQRPLRKWHVRNLAKEMSNGRFRSNTQINFCKLGEYFHLTNGQHTLRAIVECGKEQNLCVIVEDVSSDTEIADDFTRHDTHLTRRLSDSLVAHEIHIALDCTPTALSVITAACVFYAFGLRELETRAAQAATHDTKLAIVSKYGELGKHAYTLIEGAKKESYMVRKTTLASVMFTISKMQNEAEEFWKGIVEDDGLRRGDPRKTLLEYLRETNTTGSTSGVRKIKRTAGDHVLVKGIAAAWNAFIDRRELVLIRPMIEGNEAKFNGVGVLRV